MVEKKVIFITIGIILLVGVILFFGKNYSSKDGFAVAPSYPIKMSIPKGGEAVVNLKILNYEKSTKEFKIYFNDLKDVASVNVSNFSLEGLDYRDILVNFKDNNLRSGVYYGKLIIESDYLKKEIPIALIIEDPNKVFAIIQKNLPKYDIVIPGDKLGVEITIFDLNSNSLKEVHVTYSIVDFDQKILFSSQENLIVGEKYGFSKLFDIPSNIVPGEYLLITSVNYKGTDSISGHVFTVSKEKTSESFSGEFSLFVGIVIIFIFSIVVLFFYFVKSRDELLLELRRQQNNELKRNMEIMDKYKSETNNLPKLKKKENRLILENYKKELVKKIRTKQEKQVKEFKKLKKQGKRDVLKKKLNDWKKQGYRTFDVKSEIKKLSKQGMKKKTGEWKKQGYRLGPLSK